MRGGVSDGKFNWKTGLFVIGYHVALLIMLPLYFMHYSPSAGMWIATVVLFFATGMSITGGYHRYYSHLSYKAHPVVEWFLLFFGSMATQGSALRWSYEHRIHHAYVDTDRDPYSIKKGFWYAHIMWLFERPNEIEKKVVPDLLKNPLLVFQHKHYAAMMLSTNLLAFLVVGWLLNDYVGAFVLAWWTRIFFLHHCTWFINSLAHTWGERPFSQEESAVDNYVISLLTFGEGYHNYHHTFASDYRNGIRWYNFDPTKWMIWFLNRVGLAHNLKRVNTFHVKERLIQDHKQELLEVLKESLITGKDELRETVSKASDEISQKLAAVRQMVDQYYETKELGTVDKDTLKAQTKEIKTLKKSLRQDWKRFHDLHKTIMNGPHYSK